MNKIINVYIKNYDRSLQTESIKLYNLIDTKDRDKFIAAKVNNVVTSLSYTLKVSSNIEFLEISTPEGMEVYKRSLSFLLSKAVNELFPEKTLVIMHSMGNGYYYEFENEKVTEDELKKIEDRMRDDISKNKEIARGKLSYSEAIEIFSKKGYEDKLALLKTLNYPVVVCYKCDQYFEMVDAPLSLSTWILSTFALIKYEDGFILQFPSINDINTVSPFKEQKNIFMVYKKYKELGKILKVNNVGSLNTKITQGKIKEIVQIEEAMQEGKIMELASEIYKRRDRVKLVTIAGPSSSGKTTFSKRLELQLKAHGLKPKTISVDNYFVDRTKTPLDENGKYDYESIYALNLDAFNEHLQALLNGKSTKLLKYDFQTGLSTFTDEEYKLEPDEIIIIEGIHCLNEKLTYLIDRENKYKIYISALTQMNIDNVNRIPTTDNRIIRRIVRDYKYRGHSALQTIQMWPSVRRGEEQNIFPFQNEADGYFNSALDYELSILKVYAEPILMQVKPDVPEYGEASRLLKFLSYFLPVPANIVPPNSIIREFIGGSMFSY